MNSIFNSQIQEILQRTADIAEMQSLADKLSDIDQQQQHIDPFLQEELTAKLSKAKVYQTEVKQFLESIAKSPLSNSAITEAQEFLAQASEQKVTFPQIKTLSTLETNFKLELHFKDIKSDTHRRPLGEMNDLLEAFRRLPFVSLCVEELYDMIEQGTKLSRVFAEAQKAMDHQALLAVIQMYEGQKVMQADCERFMEKYVKGQNDIKAIENEVEALPTYNYFQMHKLCQQLDALQDDFFDPSRLSNLRKELFVHKVRLFQSAWERKDVSQEMSLRGLKDWLNEGAMLGDRFPGDHMLYQRQQWLGQVSKQVQKRIDALKKINKVEYLESLDNSKDRHVEGLVDFSEELIEHKTAIEMMSHLAATTTKQVEVEVEQEKAGYQNSSTTQQQPSLVQFQAEEVEGNSKQWHLQELEDFKRAAKRTMRRDTKKYRQKTLHRMRHQRVQRKNGNECATDEDDESPLMYDRTYIHKSTQNAVKKQNIMTVLQRAILNNKQWRLKPMDAIEFAIGLAEVVRGQGPVHAESMVSFVTKLQRFAGLSSQIQDDNFSIDCIADLYLRSSKYLEAEERKALAKQFNHIQKLNQARKLGQQKEDYTIKRKKLNKGKANTNPNTNANTVNELKVVNNDKPKQLGIVSTLMQMEQNQSKTAVQPLVTQQTCSSLPQTQTSTIDIIQSVFQDKNLLQQFRIQNGTLNNRRLFMEQVSPQKSTEMQMQSEHEGEFSEDEAQGQLFRDIEPVREEETEEFLIFLKKLAGIQHTANRKILYDPDAEMDIYNDASNTQKMHQTHKGLPIAGSTLKVFEGQIKGLTQTQQHVLITLHSCQHIKQLMKFPAPQTNHSLKVESKISAQAFDTYIQKLLVTKKKKRVFSGTAVASIAQQIGLLNQAFEDLRITDTVGIATFATDCKIFLLHAETMTEAQKRIVNYVEPLNANQSTTTTTYPETQQQYVYVVVYKYNSAASQQQNADKNDKEKEKSKKQRMIQPTVVYGFYDETTTEGSANRTDTNAAAPTKNTTTTTESIVKPTAVTNVLQPIAFTSSQQANSTTTPSYIRQIKKEHSRNLLSQLANPGSFADNLRQFSQELSLMQAQQTQQAQNNPVRSESQSRAYRSGSSGRALKNKIMQSALTSIIFKKTRFDKIASHARKYTENEPLYQMQQKSASKPKTLPVVRELSQKRSNSRTNNNNNNNNNAVQTIQTQQNNVNNNKPMSFRERRSASRSMPREVSQPRQANPNPNTFNPNLSTQDALRIPTFMERKRERSRSRSVTRDEANDIHQNSTKIPTFMERKRERSRSRSVTRNESMERINTNAHNNYVNPLPPVMTFDERVRERSRSRSMSMRKSMSVARPRGVSLLRPADRQRMASASHHNEFIEDLHSEHYFSQGEDMMQNEMQLPQQQYQPTQQFNDHQSTLAQLLTTINKSLNQLLKPGQNQNPRGGNNVYFSTEEDRGRSMSQFRGESAFRSGSIGRQQNQVNNRPMSVSRGYNQSYEQNGQNSNFIRGPSQQPGYQRPQTTNNRPSFPNRVYQNEVEQHIPINNGMRKSISMQRVAENKENSYGYGAQPQSFNGNGKQQMRSESRNRFFFNNNQQQAVEQPQYNYSSQQNQQNY